MSTSWIIVFGIGILARVVLFHSDLSDPLSYRHELATPVSSYHRRDVFHQPPLVLVVLCPVLSHLSWIDEWLWIGCDVLIAWMLMQSSKRLKEESLHVNHGCPLSPLFDVSNLPTTVAMLYLLNPYTLASCCARSSVHWTHLFTSGSLYAMLHRNTLLSMLCLSIAAYLSIYPVVLLVPLWYAVEPHQRIAMLVQFAFCSAYLHGLSFLLIQEAYVYEAYWWIFRYRDLTPNVGVFWYFFMEVFERFRNYFLLVMHAHPIVYLAPLAFRLRHREFAFAHVLIGIFSLFQAYPTMGDLGFTLSLLAMHPHTISFMQNRYALAIGLAVGTIMLPIMHYLWLQPGSGNANFYYNQTLVYQVFVSLILIGFVKATMKRDRYKVES